MVVNIVIQNPQYSKQEDLPDGKQNAKQNRDEDHSIEGVLKIKNIQSQKNALGDLQEKKLSIFKKSAPPVPLIDFDKTYDNLYVNFILTRKSSPTPFRAQGKQKDEDNEDLRIWKVYF